MASRAAGYALLVRTAPLALIALAAACGRGARDTPAEARRRFLELLDALPRIEAEERAWPRPDSLACDERAAARARELEAMRDEIADVGARLAPALDARPAIEAADELRACAGCGAEHIRRCVRARELIAEAQA